ncbi:T9SS type A sorting domain-containing protein [uncultured Parabacteroides sp.]|uniref:T9SS type A sorting domain-containing protein n=1 Tax=uncultured Parabacteroides sp. TaxID=512312 RepID=UPI0025E8E6DD|nr:T9SS type A sorting domain-containing protein [uncultured Parabacteroides sp.]
MKRIHKITYYSLLLLAFLLGGSTVGYGQEKETVTFTRVEDNNAKLKIIRHRNGIDPENDRDTIEKLLGRDVEDIEKKIESIQAISSEYKTKWHEKRPTDGEYEDTFNNDQYYFDPVSSTGIHNISQVSHTYVDSIYFYPGEEVHLYLPTMILSQDPGHQAKTTSKYVRWYNYKNGSTDFEDVDFVFYKEKPFQSEVTAYQYRNGYVSFFTNKNVDLSNKQLTRATYKYKGSEPKHWDLIACNISPYNDAYDDSGSTTTEGDQIAIEPTLTQRVIFYLKSVFADNGLIKMAEEVTSDGRYLKEFTIHFPTVEQAKKLGDLENDTEESGGNCDTRNNISLSMQAQNYCLDKDEQGGYIKGKHLIVTLEDGAPNGLQISPYAYAHKGNKKKHFRLPHNGTGSVVKDGKETEDEGGQTIHLGGRSSNIFLIYPEKGVPKGSQAVITVTNEAEHNIAQYTIIFDENTQGLTETALKQIKDMKEEEEKVGAKEISIEDKCSEIQTLFNGLEDDAKKQLLDQLYTRTDEYMQKTYGEPYVRLNWDYKGTPNNKGGLNYYPYPMNWDYSTYGFVDGDNMFGNIPQWGQYAIIDRYLSGDNATTWTDGLSNDKKNYHLYVDASDQPGVVAKLPLRRELCKNTRLYITAWMKSGAWKPGVHDAGVTFSFKGVKADGTETYLHRYASGQIRRSDYNGLTEKKEKNEWFQLYTSFTNTSDENYESYLVQIENNGASTNGADFYLDDICVYIDDLGVDAKQENAPCGGQIDIDIEIDKEKLNNRISGGEKEEDLVVYYSFINKKVYDKVYNKDEGNAALAFSQAVIHGNGVYQHHQGEEHRPGGECFFGSFLTKENGQEDVTIKDGKIIFCSNILPVYNTPQIGDEENELHYMVAGEEYYIAVMAYKVNDNGCPFTLKATKDDIANAYELGGDCKIIGNFEVREPDIKIIYGDANSSPEQFCLGQQVPINVTISDETKKILEENKLTVDELAVDYFWSANKDDYDIMCYDETWRVIAKLREDGNREEYLAGKIEGALEKLSLDEITTDVNLLEKIKETIIRCVKNNTLYLTATSSGKEEMGISLKDLILVSNPMYYVVFPIEQSDITSSHEDETEASGYRICWKSIPGVVNATASPKLNTGFQQVDYPKWNYNNPAVRIGLDELEKVRVEDTDVTKDITTNNTLRIPLRNPRDSEGEPAGLRLLDNDSKIYLVGTDDPEQKLNQAVGEIKTLVAKKDYIDNSNYMDIVFYKTFEPCEGYTYHLNFQFQLEKEVATKDVSKASTCTIGSLTFPMHIVPKYQKWIGTKTDNWNDDSKWIRSTSDELKKNDYTKYEAPYAYRGFVPMAFTYVTIPTETPQIELYAPVKRMSAGNDNLAILDLTKAGLGLPTHHIEYDLMADATQSVSGNQAENTGNVAYYCRPYYTNTVKEIHFEPNTEMLHTELLTYEKAWVDYDLAPNRWYTLASPLKAVVAGDWYVPSDGYQQNTEYFKPITFKREGEGTNNRFDPAVYQCSWDKGEVTRVELESSSIANKNYSIKGNWSIVYNDVEAPYDPGQGFSIKTVAATTTNNNGNVLFRLPKDDPSYNYYDDKGQEQGNATVRDVSCQTGQFHHSNEGSKEKYIVTIENKETDNNYFLVGNPFMAHLNMTNFFKANENQGLDNTFWIVEDGNQKVSVKDGNAQWLSTLGDKVSKVAPLQSFFVKKAETKGTGSNELSLTFTNDMQVLGEENSNNPLRSASSAPQLLLTASKGGKQSRALIVCKASADDAFRNNEDAELFLDSNLGDVPMVYTVAGSQTASINVRKNLTNIPLGVFAPDNGEVEVTISGQESFGNFELYDAENNHSQLIGNGEVSVMLKGNTHGRYFLRSDYVPTANEKVTAQKQIIIYSASNGQIVVSSVDPLTRITVYDLSGKLVTGLTHLHTPTAYVQGLTPGQLYIVRAETANQVQTEKVEVR